MNDDDQRLLFELPPASGPEELPRTKPISEPLWTRNKARLVQSYLRLFVQVTKHGTYLDGFAGPQEEDRPEMWAARLVLDIQLIRHFHWFEQRKASVDRLDALRTEALAVDPTRSINIYPGDFNARILDVLGAGVIGAREAAFCLLDQRTFECHWASVEALAQHKTSGYKIELFYFLAQKWMDRALHEKKDYAGLEAWWGRADWSRVLGLKGPARAQLFAERFREIGYRFVWPWPILEREAGMAPAIYYMIHATDHPAAPPLMGRAYEAAVVPVDDQQSSFGWPIRPHSQTR